MIKKFNHLIKILIVKENMSYYKNTIDPLCKSLIKPTTISPRFSQLDKAIVIINNYLLTKTIPFYIKISIQECKDEIDGILPYAPTFADSIVQLYSKHGYNVSGNGYHNYVHITFHK